MNSIWNRRSFLKTVAGTSGLLAASGMNTQLAFAQDEEAEPTPEPVEVGEGDVSLTMWVQDFGPAIDFFRTGAETYIAQGNNVRVTVQPIPSEDLLARMLPSIAAGNEADIIMGYTDWFVATDISQLFLRLDEFMGGREALEESLFPSTLNTLNLPDDAVYYLPWAAGARSATGVVNAALFEEAGIDHSSFETWDDVVDAAQALTVTENGSITRSGLSVGTGQLSLVKSWIWQMGGEFYDQESGEWTLASAEGEEALQRLVDLYQGENPVSTFELGADTDMFVQERLASSVNGVFNLGSFQANNPELSLGGFAVPQLAEAIEDVIYPEHLGVITLSRRLADDEAKREHAIGIAEQLFNTDALIELANSYSGLLCSKVAYDDPRMMETTFGPATKPIAEATWERARFPGDHVANSSPAITELENALRGDASVSDALQAADSYLNDQEQQARERLGL